MKKQSYTLQDLDNMSPHNCRDGKWGGWGPSYWINAEQFGFAKADVVEWDRIYTNSVRENKWIRIWVDKDQKWREVNNEDLKRLPVLKQLETRFE